MQRNHCDLGEISFMRLTKSSITVRELRKGKGGRK